MQRFGIWLAAAVAVVIALLAAMNWQTLSTPTQVDLLATRAEAPLGLLMLALTGALLAIFVLVLLRNQISSLLETRKLLKDVQRLQGLADQAEASRIESLRQLIASEFRSLNERLGPSRPAADNPLVRVP